MPRSNSLHAVDLFAGCGGLSLGLKQAGFKTIAYSEINKDAEATFRRNLGGEADEVGAVDRLTTARISDLKSRWGHVDLVCGGPPCQGYSGIGHRRTHKVDRAQVPSNHLFREMVRVVQAFQPKAFLFENVRGLLAGRWTEEGTSGEIWQEVRETFGNLNGYEIGWRVLQAKWFGVPQKRPRVILVGVRRETELATVGNEDNAENNPRGLLPEPSAETAPHLVDVLSDLEDPEFSAKRATEHYLVDAQTDFQRAMRRTKSGRTFGKGALLTEQEYSRHSARVTAKFVHMLENDGDIPEEMRTKKFAQRVLPERWKEQGPTITATSLPDDYVHYRFPRILTVREWARLQTFPDWYEFEGPRTTGGHRRAGVPHLGIWDREVPKYTQIGNAVPVRLAYHIGKHLAGLLAKV
jgi:DNA (cytosine-5)-methyltransferase 1